LSNWVSEWGTTAEQINGTVQALELTPAKEIVWALDAWTPPADLGPGDDHPVLDEPSAPEDVHFGEIR